MPSPSRETNPFLSHNGSSTNHHNSNQSHSAKPLSRYYLTWINKLFHFRYLQCYSQLSDCIAYNVFLDFITRRGTSLQLAAFPEDLEELYQKPDIPRVSSSASGGSPTRGGASQSQHQNENLQNSSSGGVQGMFPSLDISIQSASPLPEDEIPTNFRSKTTVSAAEDQTKGTISNSASDGTVSNDEDNTVSVSSYRIYPRIIPLAQCKENASLLNETISRHNILLSSSVKKNNLTDVDKLTKQDEMIHYQFLKFLYTYWKRYYKDLSIEEYNPKERIATAWAISEDNRKAYIEEEKSLSKKKEVLSDEEHFKRAFQMIDLDGNGELSLHEIQQFAFSSVDKKSSSFTPNFNTPESIEGLKVLMREAKGDASVLTERRFVEYMMKQKEQTEEEERLQRLREHAKQSPNIMEASTSSVPSKRKKRSSGLAPRTAPTLGPRRHSEPAPSPDLHPMVLHEEDFSFLRQARLKSMLKERKRRSKQDQRLQRLTNLATPPNYSKLAQDHEIRYSFKPSIIREVPASSKAPPAPTDAENDEEPSELVQDHHNKHQHENSRSHSSKKRKFKSKRKKRKHHRHKPVTQDIVDSPSLPPRRRSTFEQEHRLRQGETIISAALRESKALNSPAKNQKRHRPTQRVKARSHKKPKGFPEATEFSVHSRRRNSTNHTVKCKACGEKIEYHRRNIHLCDLTKLKKARHRHSQPTLSHFDANNYIHRLWKRAAEEREKIEYHKRNEVLQGAFSNNPPASAHIF